MKLGLDIVSINRIRELLDDYERAADRLFAPEELLAAAEFSSARRYEFLAGRFAVKEALIKVLGAPRDLDLRDIICLRDSSGAPRLLLRGEAERTANEQGFNNIEVSVSHEGNVAMAVVLGSRS